MILLDFIAFGSGLSKIYCGQVFNETVSKGVFFFDTEGR